MPPPQDPRRERFRTTRWSVVLAARDRDAESGRAALAWLCEAYWPPLYAFARRRGHSPERAADLTQAYFVQLLEKEFLADVDAARGKFRSFLLKSMQHFLSNERDRERAAKRGGGARPVSLDRDSAERRYLAEPREEVTPESAFERDWALTLLERALERMREQARARGRLRQFERLSPFLTDARPRASYRGVARELGTNENAVKVAVHRMRRRFGELLREEIAETVADPAAVDAEIRHLFSVLAD